MTAIPNPQNQNLADIQGIVEIRCPQTIDPLSLKNSIFIAGGIGVGLNNVADWQQRMIHKLLVDLPLTALNPRRENFPSGDAAALHEQISWEHKALATAQAVLFWLPAGYSCPITVYELGVWSMRAKPIFVGIDPNYPHRDSLLAALKVARPQIDVVESLPDLAELVRSWYVGTGKICLPKARPAFQEKSLYLSGGITDCADWQSRLSSFLASENVQINNPRRNFIKSAELPASELQVLSAGNQQSLLASESFCAWFPKESKNPAALFELGVLASMPERPLFVGADPEYFRFSDVVIQTGLVRPEVRVVTSLEELAQQIKEYYQRR